MIAGGMSIPGPGMGHQNSVGTITVQCPVGLVGQGQGPQQATAFQAQLGIEMGIFSCDQADTVTGVHVGSLSGKSVLTCRRLPLCAIKKALSMWERALWIQRVASIAGSVPISPWVNPSAGQELAPDSSHRRTRLPWFLRAFSLHHSG